MVSHELTSFVPHFNGNLQLIAVYKTTRIGLSQIYGNWHFKTIKHFFDFPEHYTDTEKKAVNE